MDEKETLQSERDAALARVKELERIIDDYDAMVGDLDPPDVLVHWRADRAARLAVETAMASARELLAQWLRSFPHLRSARLGVRTEEWLTSHPALASERACADGALASAREMYERAASSRDALANELSEALELLRSARTAIQQDRRPGSLFRRIGALLSSHPAPVATPLDCHTYPRELYGEGFRVAPGVNLEPPVAAPCANGNCADCNLTPCQCKVRAVPCAGCAELFAALRETESELRAALRERPFDD